MSERHAEAHSTDIDDRPLWDLEAGFWQYLSVLVAHDLALFARLAGGPRTLAELCAALSLAEHPAQALLNVCVTAGLVQRGHDDGHERYGLTALAERYMVAGRATYRGKVLDAAIAKSPAMNFATLKQAVLTNSSQIYGGDEVFAVHAAEAERAASFTEEMHALSHAPAQAWPAALDLSRHRVMLDIGGGSGAHAIGAAQRWPDLHARVFDLATVCRIAEAHIARQGLSDRLRAVVGDMWSDPYPAADLHFYSWVFHDYRAPRSRELADKSFASLPAGGRIVVHEMLYDEAKSGPAVVATLDVSMLRWTQGQEYSGGELAEMLTAAGFVEVAVKPTWGYWGVVTGVKPG